MAAGLTNKQIADRLIVSDGTAKFHVTSLLNKLGADNRTQAVAHATQRGLLSSSSHANPQPAGVGTAPSTIG